MKYQPNFQRQLITNVNYQDFLPKKNLNQYKSPAVSIQSLKKKTNITYVPVNKFLRNLPLKESSMFPQYPQAVLPQTNNCYNKQINLKQRTNYPNQNKQFTNEVDENKLLIGNSKWKDQKVKIEFKKEQNIFRNKSSYVSSGNIDDFKNRTNTSQIFQYNKFLNVQPKTTKAYQIQGQSLIPSFFLQPNQYKIGNYQAQNNLNDYNRKVKSNTQNNCSKVNQSSAYKMGQIYSNTVQGFFQNNNTYNQPINSQNGRNLDNNGTTFTKRNSNYCEATSNNIRNIKPEFITQFSNVYNNRVDSNINNNFTKIMQPVNNLYPITHIDSFNFYPNQTSSNFYPKTSVNANANINANNQFYNKKPPLNNPNCDFNISSTNDYNVYLKDNQQKKMQQRVGQKKGIHLSNKKSFSEIKPYSPIKIFPTTANFNNLDIKARQVKINNGQMVSLEKNETEKVKENQINNYDYKKNNNYKKYQTNIKKKVSFTEQNIQGVNLKQKIENSKNQNDHKHQTIKYKSQNKYTKPYANSDNTLEFYTNYLNKIKTQSISINQSLKDLPNKQIQQTQSIQKITRPVHSNYIDNTYSKEVNHQGPRNFTLNDFVRGKLLGLGKFGDVYLVKQKNTGTAYALKSIHKSGIKQNELQYQFIRQIKIQFYLNHPNLIKLYCVFQDQKHYYLLQELATDGQLYKILQSQKRFSEILTAFYINQILEGVFYMHRHNIIHRDIKPQNLVLQNGMVKICDFGWAVQVKNKMRKTFCGTPDYVSPEILLGQQYDYSTDIWAIGILAYEFLFGKTPFPVLVEEDIKKIVQQKLQFPQDIKISDQAKQFIEELLEKKPQKRSKLLKIKNHRWLIKRLEEGKGMIMK